MGFQFRFDNSESIKDLGINYRDVKDTLISTAYSFIDFNLIPHKIPKSKLWLFLFIIN